MKYLVKIWQKFFKKRELVLVQEYWHKDGTRELSFQAMTYDPSQDEERILSGEIESYFE